MFFAPSRIAAGTIAPFGGGSAPPGWLDCFGQAVSRTTYAALFNAIGATYGAGDGSTTFNVPDFRGRNVLGAGTGSGLTNRLRGSIGGSETHPLTSAENAAHSHTESLSTDNTGLAGQIVGTSRGAAVLNTGSSGSGTAHPNMPPWGCAAYIIKF